MELTGAIFSNHAADRLIKRDIEVETVMAVLAGPESVAEVRPGRVVVQGVVGEYLLRVFVDVDRQPPEIVTAYRTSKIGKYRRMP
jgi:hypothetical protein